MDRWAAGMALMAEASNPLGKRVYERQRIRRGRKNQSVESDDRQKRAAVAAKIGILYTER